MANPQFNITNGPSVEMLFLALRLVYECREVDFTFSSEEPGPLVLDGKAAVSITMIATQFGVWDLKFTTVDRTQNHTQKWRGWYNPATRTGKAWAE